jgi:hypothetical protein
MNLAQNVLNSDVSSDDVVHKRRRSSVEYEHNGITNNNYIIPPYYFNEEHRKGKLLDIDFGWTIIDSVRNLRPLTSYQLEFLQSLSSEKLIEIIHEYNRIMQTYVQSLILDGSDF